MFINCSPVLGTETFAWTISVTHFISLLFATWMIIKVAEKVSNEFVYYPVNVHVDYRCLCMQSHSYHHTTNSVLYHYPSSNAFSFLSRIFTNSVFLCKPENMEIFLTSLHSYTAYIINNWVMLMLTTWRPYNLSHLILPHSHHQIHRWPQLCWGIQP